MILDTLNALKIWVAGDDEKEPKRRVLCRLGPRYVFLRFYMFGKHEVGSGGRWRQKRALGMSFFVHVQVSSFVY